MQLIRSESVSLYVSRLIAVDRKLQEQGEQPQSASILLFVLLRGLPSEFATVVTLLKMREKLTFDEAVEAIKNEEENMKMGSRKKKEETALFAAKGGASGFRCFTCNESGHVQYNCPQNGGKKPCTRCRRVGHVVAECRATMPSMEEAANFAFRMQREQEEEDEWSA